MEKFSHSALNLDRPAIRLLRLLKGTEPSVECEIFQAYLDTTYDDLIPYEALSYTWGGTETAAVVQIDGLTYNVTENLYLALLHLRLADEDRILWVDAICIDQRNLRERGHQVEQMGSIYSLANRVIIWLGQGTEESDMLLNTLKQLETQGRRSWNLSDSRWPEIWSSLQSDLKRQDPQFEENQRGALQSLLERQWFQRVWIIQEVANAKRAIVCCGRRSVSAYILALAPLLMDVHPKAQCQAILDIFPGQSRNQSWWNANRKLYNLLQKFSASKASDPRDRIYALLGICSDSDKMDSLRADYTQSLHQVINDTAMFLFELPMRSKWYTMFDFVPCVIRNNRDTLDVVVRSKTPTWIDAYIRSRADPVHVTEAVLKAVADNQAYGEEIFEHLLRQKSVSVDMSKGMFSTAPKIEFESINALDMLYKHRSEQTLAWAAKNDLDAMNTQITSLGHEITISTQVLEAAASNIEAGAEVMSRLLQHKSHHFSIESCVVETAITNPGCNLTLLKLLFDQESGTFTISEQLTKRITGLSKPLAIWVAFLQLPPAKVDITAGAIENLSKCRYSLVDHTGVPKAETSQKIFRDKICDPQGQNYEQSMDARGLTILIKYLSGETKSLQTSDDEKEEMWMLLLEEVSGAPVNRRLVKAMLQHRDDGRRVLGMLLCNYGFKFRRSGNVITATEMNDEQASSRMEAYEESWRKRWYWEGRDWRSGPSFLAGKHWRRRWPMDDKHWRKRRSMEDERWRTQRSMKYEDLQDSWSMEDKHLREIWSMEGKNRDYVLR